MADRAPQPTLTITEGRVADILAWIITHAREINEAPMAEIVISWGGGSHPKARLTRHEVIQPLAGATSPN